jgi:hypothetical protein
MPKDAKLKIVLLLFIVSMFIPTIVSAETFSGIVEAPSTGNYNSWIGTYDGYVESSGKFTNLTIGNIESSGGLSSVIYFPFQSPGNAQGMSWTGVGSNVSAVTHFDAYIGNTPVGSGMIGFQRIFNWLGQEQIGYAYIVFNTWYPPTTMTGTKILNLTFSDADLYYMRSTGYGSGGSISGKTYINNGACGNYEISTVYDFKNYYEITQPSGLGVAGVVNKTVDTKVYPSRVFFQNELTGAAFADEGSINNYNFNFTFRNTSYLRLAILDPNGNWYNKSFQWNSTITITPTPTPYPSNATNTTLAAGYARSEIYVRDAITNGLISGVNINLKDVKNNSWSNSSSDTDGIFWIDTLPNDYININLDYPGVYYSLSAQNQDTPTTAGQTKTFTEVLYPITTTETGNVSYVISVYDKSTSATISGATVSASYMVGSTTKINGSTSNSVGTVVFTVPSNTALSITASKTGYISGTKIINSGPDAYNSTIVYLTTATTTVSTTKTGVIATKTTVTGNVTVVTTTPVQYTGFWGPIADWFSAMGAEPSAIGIILAAIFVFVGACVGGWSAAPYQMGAPFNPQASMIGGVLGFILSVAFGFIPFVYIVAVFIIGLFWFILFGR